MESVDSSSFSKWLCEYCDGTFSSKFNYNRHMLRIHGIDECSNLNNICSNNNKSSGNFTQELSHHSNKENRCNICLQTFKSKWYLSKHVKKCSEEQDKKEFSCDLCHKKFKNHNSIYRHRTICKSLQVVPSIHPKNESEIMIYNPFRMIFKKNHIHQDNFIHRLLEKINHRINHTIVLDYAREILTHPENKCIQKKSLKVSHSEVHIGENNWNLKIDQTIYPHLASNLANELSEIIYINRDTIPIHLFNQTIKFLDYMSDEGYINTENETEKNEIKREFTYLVRELKLIIYDITRGSLTMDPLEAPV